MEKRDRIIELLTTVRYTTNNIEKVADEICLLFDVVGRSEQLADEKLCRMNQNFVCNCIDNSRCPNFKG
jgi:hypothetical protein